MTDTETILAKIAEIEARATIACKTRQWEGSVGHEVICSDSPALTAALKRAVEALERYELAAFDVKGEIFSVGSVAREALADIAKILEAKT